MSNNRKWLLILVLAVIALFVYGFINRNLLLGKKLDIDNLEHRVENYISSIDSNLEISDIFIYSDSDYYFSIEEKDTGMGAMELLVNPYTGRIRPEMGPNMMWNRKYNVHQGGMMGRYNYNDFNSNKSFNEAIALANNYVKEYMISNYYVPNKGHEFYGYYTFHIEENGVTKGMLSVNSYSGEVWVHDWHGTLVSIVSRHED